MPPALSAVNPADALHEAFGFREFRPLQEEAVGAALAGRDLLVVMPTGAGKSLCFQLPALLAHGVTLVVSPLIALMRDQVDALNRRPAFAEMGCACLTSLQSTDELRGILAGVRAGRVRLLYVAPERFRSGGFLDTLRCVPVARLVVDEAHCISEWGHDFRPDYLGLKAAAEALGNPPITAVTATATRRVQQSIVANLAMRDPVTLVGGFNRPNLHFAVHRCRTEREREERLSRALPKLAARPGSGLIYVATRRQCEEIAEIASAALRPSGKQVGLYHAGLESEERSAMQQRWLDGDLHTLVATNAFGMGIDKADVRFVIHCACPDSLESYYQEAGRAGRDGRKSRCAILYHFTDRRTREWFIDNDALTPEIVQRVHLRLCEAAHGEETLRLSKAGLARMLGPNDRANGLTLRLALGELERAALIQRLGETQDDLTLRLLSRTFPPEALRRIQADLAALRKERYRRLDEMTDYCKTTDCRRRTVLSYFGDREEPPPSAFCCDNCDNPPALKPHARTAGGPAAPMPTEIDGGDIYAVLQGLDALRPALGRSRLNKLLRATGTRETPGFRPEKSPLYGVLRGCTRGQVDTFLGQLVDSGYLHLGDEDEYFVCTVTQAGRDMWQARGVISISPPRPPGEMRAVDEAGAGELYEGLRTWRTREASALRLPPYCILSDKTLREIAGRRPESLDELQTVPGIGPRKIEQYGPAVLIILQQYAGA